MTDHLLTRGHRRLASRSPGALALLRSRRTGAAQHRISRSSLRRSAFRAGPSRPAMALGAIYDNNVALSVAGASSDDTQGDTLLRHRARAGSWSSSASTPISRRLSRIPSPLSRRRRAQRLRPARDARVPAGRCRARLTLFARNNYATIADDRSMSSSTACRSGAPARAPTTGRAASDYRVRRSSRRCRPATSMTWVDFDRAEDISA